MLEIKVYDDSDNGYFLDIYKNAPINLTYQYSNIEKIQAAVGSFTRYAAEYRFFRYVF